MISDRPGASDEFGTTDSGFPITIDTLAGDTDPAGTAALVPSSVTILSGPSNGTATIDPQTGEITYKSIFGFNGTDVMTYTVTDTQGAVSNVGTISIVVNRPTAEPDFATTAASTQAALKLAANDSDPDGNQFLDASSILIAGQPSNGSAYVASSGNVTYTPDNGFAGVDTFEYTIADAHGARSNPAVVTVTVLAPTRPGAVVVDLPEQPAPTALSGQDADTLYVAALYRDVLGRQADQAGLTYWVGQLQDGLTRPMVAQDFLHSTEHFTNEVTNYYQTFLNRAPRADELAFWVGTLQAGATEQQVVLGFLTSPEFLRQHSSSDNFVNALYSDVLGRKADAAGLAFWEGALAAGKLTDAQVVLGFLNSAEEQKYIVDSYYSAFLGHAGDSAGEAGWLASLSSNQASLDAVAVGFLTSSEYESDVTLGIK